MDTQVKHIDIRIVKHGDRVTQVVRSAIADVAHTNNLKVTITETPFEEYTFTERKSLVVIAYDIAKENVAANSELAELLKAIERADMEAPDVQLAILEDSVSSEVMDDWMTKLSDHSNLLPFDPVKQPDILIAAVRQDNLYVPIEVE